MEMLILTAMLAGFALGVWIWLWWINYCLRYWVQIWAVGNSCKLLEYTHLPLGGGPYRLTFFHIFPVFRVHVSDENGFEKFGWLWLDIGYFYWGKGKVTWDTAPVMLDN